MKKLLTVSHSPHIRHEDSVYTIAGDYIIALAPMAVWAGYIFGMRAVVNFVLCAFSCLVFDMIYRAFLKKGENIFDPMAVIMGILLSYTLPVGVPLWLTVAGALIAVLIKEFLCGMISAVALTRVLVGFLPWARQYSLPFEKLNLFADAQFTPTKTALDMLGEGIIPEFSVFDVFVGNTAGGIGEVSALLILAGGLYLIVRRVIKPHIPLTFILCAGIFAFFLPQSVFQWEYTFYQLFSGGLMLCAVFISADSTCCPLTGVGKIIYGALGGIITMALRRFFGFEGVYYAVVIINLAVILIDKFTLPVPFGCKIKKAKE